MDSNRTSREQCIDRSLLLIRSGPLVEPRSIEMTLILKNKSQTPTRLSLICILEALIPDLRACHDAEDDDHGDNEVEEVKEEEDGIGIVIGERPGIRCG